MTTSWSVTMNSFQLSPEVLSIAFGEDYYLFEAYAMNADWDRRKQAEADGITPPLMEGAL